MAYSASRGAYSTEDYSYQPREPGARRKKLAGYLKAANDLRQSYFGVESNLHHEPEDGPGNFPNAAVVRSGNEEMILFPSYGKFHVKSRAKQIPQAGDSVSEEEYWRQEWKAHENSTAVVDVDVRGWIYTPHRGPNTRKQRLLIGLARQLSGLPAPAPRTGDSAAPSAAPSRSSSPTRISKQEEDDLIQFEADNIVRRGQREEQYAARGNYSESPSASADKDSLYGDNDRKSAPPVKRATTHDISGISPVQKRSSWSSTTKLTPEEAISANKNLLTRLQPFMHNALANSPISAFFYNNQSSKQQTIYTDASGHFAFHTALNFVPTHVKILAGEKLSVTEEVTVIDRRGVSLISDIDDTIKHSAISAGPREIFRNAFLRELSDLTIEGVREWYTRLHDLGVRFHYVSNSPWQMYPALTSFFKLAKLPRGSFHLKQYTGMLQGIFEPVAERKKSSLDKIMRDFPDRRFILVGDSGEADLEVYTDVALDNPGRILGIFIRDVTSTVRSGYFDPNTTPQNGSKNSSQLNSRQPSSDNLAMSKRLSRPNDIRDDDTELKAAIAASLEDMQRETDNARRAINPDLPKPGPPRVPPRRNQQTSASMKPQQEDLIDFSDGPAPSEAWLAPPSAQKSSSHDIVNGRSSDTARKPSPSPPPPPKPQALKVTSSIHAATTHPDLPARKPAPPPRPLKPSTTIHPLTPIASESSTPDSQSTNPTNPPPSTSTITKKLPPPLPTRRSYREIAQSTISRALPTVSSTWQSDLPGNPRSRRASSLRGNTSSQPSSPLFRGNSQPSSPLSRGATMTSGALDEFALPDAALGSSVGARPPLPARRGLSSYSGGSWRGHRRSESWNDEDGYGGSGGGGGGGGMGSWSPSLEGMSKKEYLWKQRWARAKDLLEPRGVTLRTWRTGNEVVEVCVKLVEGELREIGNGRA